MKHVKMDVFFLIRIISAGILVLCFTGCTSAPNNENTQIINKQATEKLAAHQTDNEPFKQVGNTTCSCVEDTKKSTDLIVTNITINQKADANYLLFRCASVRHLHLSNNQGQDFEKDELDCISDKNISLKMAKEFEYYIPEASRENSSTEAARQLFYKEVKTNYTHFYKVALDENRTVKLISRFWLTDQAQQPVVPGK